MFQQQQQQGLQQLLVSLVRISNILISIRSYNNRLFQYSIYSVVFTTILYLIYVFYDRVKDSAIKFKRFVNVNLLKIISRALFMNLFYPHESWER